jgi:hypothetical protein
VTCDDCCQMDRLNSRPIGIVATGLRYRVLDVGVRMGVSNLLNYRLWGMRWMSGGFKVRGHVSGVPSGQSQNFHALSVAMIIVSESCHQTYDREGEVSPRKDPSAHVYRPTQNFPQHLPSRPLGRSGRERRCGSLSPASDLTGGTEFCPTNGTQSCS